MKLSVLVFIVAGLSLMFVADSALAAPAWRGDDGSTWQEWYFNDDNTNSPPDDYRNDYGIPFAEVSPTTDSDIYHDPSGFWYGSVFKLGLDIPNNPVPNLYKEMWVEIRMKGEIGLSWAVNQDSEEFTLIDSYSVPDGDWTIVTNIWYIEPNPSFEYLCYGFCGIGDDVAALDYVKVDTICIPEPLTIGLLGLGGLMLNRRKRM